MAGRGNYVGMANLDELKTALHDELRWAWEAMLGKVEGLSDYDVRRPMTGAGTNLLGLIKHLSMGESNYPGEVFGRPFPEPLPWSRPERSRRPSVPSVHLTGCLASLAMVFRCNADPNSSFRLSRTFTISTRWPSKWLRSPTGSVWLRPLLVRWDLSTGARGPESRDHALGEASHLAHLPAGDARLQRGAHGAVANLARPLSGLLRPGELCCCILQALQQAPLVCGGRPNLTLPHARRP